MRDRGHGHEQTAALSVIAGAAQVITVRSTAIVRDAQRPMCRFKRP
jgi:hypothetical protein